MSDTIKTESFERVGVTFKVEYITDYHHDIDRLGEYSDQWQEGAIDRATWREITFTSRSCHVHTYWEASPPRGEYRWFIPACDPSEVEAERAAFCRLGYSRHEAWLRASKIPRWQYRAVEALQRGDWCHIGISVTAYVNKVEVASSSLWGIECGQLPDVDNTLQESYHQEIVEDCIAECLAQLPATVETLQAVVTQLQTVPA